MKTTALTSLLLLALPVANAFPAGIFNNPAVRDSLIQAVNRDLQPRSSNSTLANLVNGILNGSLPGVPFPSFNLPLGLGSLLLEVPPVVAIGRKAIPDSQHPFQAPGPTDQRGGCPGLNIMANYGYIPRNGVTTLTQLLWAQQEMLGVAPDLAAILVAFAAIAAVDPTTLKVSIGNVDTRTSGLLSLVLGQAPGIFDKVSHNEYEVDGSTAYTDSYFVPDGTTNHFNSSKWATAIQIAQENGNLFGPDWLAAMRYRSYTDCVNTNPTCSWEEKQILFYAANGFAQSIMPYSDANGVPTAPTIEAISAFFGVQDNGDGTYTKIPEKLLPGPDGVWYRRSVPLTGSEQVLIALQAYLAHPVIFGTNSGSPNSFTGSPDQIGSVITGPSPFCVVFTEMQDLIPSYLKPVQTAIVGLSDMLLAPLRLSLGC